MVAKDRECWRKILREVKARTELQCLKLSFQLTVSNAYCRETEEMQDITRNVESCILCNYLIAVAISPQKKKITAENLQSINYAGQATFLLARDKDVMP